VFDLTVMEVVGSEPEAVLVCSILRDAGIQCMHRVTNIGSGAMDGLTMGGPREIVVHPDQLQLARHVIREQRDGPPPTSGRGRGGTSSPQLTRAIATRSTETPDDRVADSVLSRL
jgi:hypothetical protein